MHNNKTRLCVSAEVCVWRLVVVVDGGSLGSSWNRKLRAWDKLSQGNSGSRSGHRRTACVTSCVCVRVNVCVNVSSINLMNCLLLSITTNHSDILPAQDHHSTCTFNVKHTNAIIQQGWKIDGGMCVREKSAQGYTWPSQKPQRHLLEHINKNPVYIDDHFLGQPGVMRQVRRSECECSRVVLFIYRHMASWKMNGPPALIYPKA